MTLKDIIDFTFQHGMGEFTPVVIFSGINEYWCGLPEQKTVQTDIGEEEITLVLPVSDVNAYRNVQAIVKAAGGRLGATVRVDMVGSLRDIVGLARGATPDGAAKALVLQV